MKRHGRKDRTASTPNAERLPRAICPSPSILKTSTLVNDDERRASEPFTKIIQLPYRPERLTSSPATLGLTSRTQISELSHSRSAERCDDPLGLTVIFEPELSPPLDIIFVHGLGGSSRATWTKRRDPETFWPKHWLPNEPGIGTARILSFGYNANFAAVGHAPITGIGDFAKDLLYSMKFAKNEHLEELGLGQVSVIYPASFKNNSSYQLDYSIETHHFHRSFHGWTRGQTGMTWYDPSKVPFSY